MPNIGFTIRHLASFSLGFRGLKGHLYLNPPGQCSSECWSKQSHLQRHLGETRGLVLVVRIAHLVCPENEKCAAPIGICRLIRAALLVLFYHCRDVL